MQPEPSISTNESNSEQNRPTSGAAGPGAERQPPSAGTKARFSPVRVLITTLVGLALAAAAAAVWVFGLPAPVTAWFQPALVPATGQVFFEGKPIAGGLIQTLPLDGQPDGAMGIVQEDGRFSFQTQVGDRYVDGIYVGRHKVAVNYGQPKMLGVIPLVPEKYFSLGTTDLTIDVRKDSTKPHFEFRLEGELTEEAQRVLGRIEDDEARPQPGAGRRGPRGGPPPGVGHGPRPADPAPEATE